MEEDQDELLQCTDDESLSENEEQCFPVNKPEENHRHTLIHFDHTKFEFLATKILLIFSTTMILILLPLYMETINVRGDVYGLILTSTAISTVIFILYVVMLKSFCSKYKNIKILKLPIRLPKLLQLSFVYFLCAFMIVYALDRKRVVCHLQDPMKGLVLIWSLLYYFFFCHKLMGLQRIFSVTIIIVGLFIAVDYGLCDEFKCRGYDRQHIADDTGLWTWQVHSIWISVYIGGLALFAAYFTLLERHLLTVNEMQPQETNIASSLLSTVSRSVSNPTPPTLSLSPDTTTEDTHLYKKFTTIHLAMWLHVFGLLMVIALFWTDFIPYIGREPGASSFFNHTINGILCHFELPTSHETDCNKLPLFSWLFVCSYLVFVVTSLKFLILTQSAVYTVATMTAALPLIGIWWSLVQMRPLESGLLVWAPSVTGEFICSVLGLPIVTIGLYLLCRAHFKDYQWSRMATTHFLSSSHLT